MFRVGQDGPVRSGLGDPPLEETTFGLSAREGERAGVGGAGVGRPAEPAQELGPGRVPVLIAGQIQAIDDGECRGRPFGFRDRHRPVQPHHVRTGPIGQLAVEGGDLRPVELFFGQSSLDEATVVPVVPPGSATSLLRARDPFTGEDSGS